MTNLQSFLGCLAVGTVISIAACGRPSSDTELAESAGDVQWSLAPTNLSRVEAPLELGQPARIDVIADFEGVLSDAGEVERSKQDGALVRSTAERITLNVSDFPTEILLDEIAEQSGVVITREYPLTNDRTTLQLVDVPLEQGLRRILNQQDIFLSFTPVTEASSTADESALLLSGVWVFSRGEGSKIVPVPARQFASSSELTQELIHSDPKVRAHAVELLIARKGEAAFDDVRFALNDQDATVRERTLQAALSAGIALPAGRLGALVQSDSSATVRSLSLAAMAGGPPETLVSDPAIEIIAQIALNDSDAGVRDQAREVLDQLKQLRQIEATSQQSENSWVFREDINNPSSELIGVGEVGSSGEE